MNKLKPITEISSADLLEFLKENPIETPNFDYKNDSMEFLSVYGIKEGPHRILFNLIYKLYKHWSPTPISKRAFADALVLLYPHIKYGESFVYMINRPREYFLERGTKKKQNKTKRKPWLKHFKKFMEKYQLKSGRFYVKDVVLYNLYDKWTYKTNKNNPLSFYQFLKFCRLFFKTPAPKQIKGAVWFSLDSNIKEKLTPDLINLMQQK